MQDPVKTFGVREFTKPLTAADRSVEEIKLTGYSIVPNVLSDAELEQARSGIDRVYQRQLEEIGGEDRLAAINDGYTARCPLAYDDYFLTVATKPEILSIVKKFLGDYFVLMLQNGIINVPSVGNEQNAGYWHRDLNYQHFISTRPISISALVCVDDFSEETGGTFVLPASHKTEAFPSEDYVQRHEQVINAKAGCAVVFDSMLYHRGGLNRSPRVRRALNHMYTLPLIKQQISLPKLLNGKFCEDSFLNRFLGYESESDESVVEFRTRRLARLEREVPS